ncbi:MAG: zinc ribbon domain-containing protein [Anaerolineales bacterium]|nr:zinc ribbon domain-containing protein [Anaerolineales bacterium]
MRKLIPLLLMGAFLALPISASAQGEAALSVVNVQLWPEYDQPSMLVIVDFQPAAETSLPVTLDFRIPADANLIAVASDAGGGRFMDFPFAGPAAEGEYQTFSMLVEQNMPYRFEYYQPLSFNGDERLFSYLWDNGYAVGSFQYFLLEPLDATRVELDPKHASVITSQGLNYYEGAPIQLTSDEQFVLTVKYQKTTDTLVSQAQSVQIAEPVNENTPGRMSLANSLPYIIGGLGVIMILGGLMYYFQWGRSSRSKPRRRHSQTEAGEDSTGVYCPQCGTRAKPNDRFCRTCGTRLRREE